MFFMCFEICNTAKPFCVMAYNGAYTYICTYIHCTYVCDQILHLFEYTYIEGLLVAITASH